MSTETLALAPLKLTPVLKEKVWGGDRLARFNKPVKPDAHIGESWELCSLPATSPDGGGGDAAHSPITATDLTLADAIQQLGNDLLGDATLTTEGAFPLLCKFLDARENLSVQVHPSPDYAATHDDAHLKTETWYILDADPGAVIYKGIKAGVTAERFRAAIADNTVEHLMNAVTARAGDTHHMPSGICHALGAGVLVAEIQMPSDTTFRVYDWGRTDRTLHIDQAMQCLTFPGEDPAPAIRADSDNAKLEHNEHYAFSQRTATAGTPIELDLAANTPRVVMCTTGAASITTDADHEPVTVRRGDTVLLPAALTRATIACQQDTAVLDVTVQPA